MHCSCYIESKELSSPIMLLLLRVARQYEIKVLDVVKYTIKSYRIPYDCYETGPNRLYESVRWGSGRGVASVIITYTFL